MLKPVHLLGCLQHFKRLIKLQEKLPLGNSSSKFCCQVGCLGNPCLVEATIGKFLLKQRLHHFLQLQSLLPLPLVQKSFHSSLTGTFHQMGNTGGKVPWSSTKQHEAEIVAHILLHWFDQRIPCGKRYSWWNITLESSSSSNASGEEVPEQVEL